MAKKILVVDDVSANLSLLETLFEQNGYEVFAAPSGAIALNILRNSPIDIVLLDILMPEMDGIETCRKIVAEFDSPPPIIFISASDEMGKLEQAFAVGGVDYINKPFRNREVLTRVANHLRISSLQRALEENNAELASQIDERRRAEDALRSANEKISLFSQQEAQNWGLDAFVGSSSLFQKISTEIRRLQNFSSTNVMILGESGVGKELVARALHYGSDKSDRPFISINCSAISENIAEAEFFGNVKGAFTGAVESRKGFFEMANGGTLFLDEVGDLPLTLQVKLLRTLENGSFYPVGSQTQRVVKVRVICATNCDLEEKMAAKSFRQDLFFRLAQFTIVVPPLRDRLDDIPGLVKHFLATFAAQMKIPQPLLSTQALKKLSGYHYPGNIRELKNIVERAIIMSNGGPIEDLHVQLQASAAASPVASLTGLSIKDVQLELAKRALQQSCGNVSEAARLIGVHRSWFYRLKNKDALDIG